MAKCCDPGAPRIFKVKLNNGTVGIIGLDLILTDVRSMEPLSEEETKRLLLKKAAVNNYIPDSSRERYAEALYREYMDFINNDKV